MRRGSEGAGGVHRQPSDRRMVDEGLPELRQLYLGHHRSPPRARPSQVQI